MKAIKDTVITSIFLLLAISLFTNLSMLVIPLFSLQIFDRVLGSGSFETLYMLLSAAVLVGIFYCYFEYRRQYLPSQVLQSVFSEFQKPLAKISCQNGNSLDYQDLSKLLSCNVNSVLLAAIDACFCPLFILVLYFLHPVFAALVGIVNLLLLAVFFLQQKILVANQQECQLNQKMHFQGMDELVRASKQLLADHRIENWIEKDQAKKYSESVSTIKNQENRFKCILHAIKWALQLSLPAVGGVLLLNNEITTGTLLAALIIGYRGLIPFEVLLGQWQLTARLVELYRKIRAFKNVNDDTLKKTIPLTQLTGRISIEALFIKTEDPHRELLSNVNIKINSAEAIVVIGENGSGKTLLIDAMSGVSPKYKGDVYFDEYNRENVNEKWLGQQIGYVPQNLLVACDSIQQVISHSSQVGCNTSRVVEVAEQLGIHKFIISLPKGYDTVIGLNGEPIPPGILQRILIASALYSKPQYLFFDEADAFLDQAGQQVFKDIILSMKTLGCTVVYSTQKRSLVDLADGIILMDKGRVHRISEIGDLGLRSMKRQA